MDTRVLEHLDTPVEGCLRHYICNTRHKLINSYLLSVLETFGRNPPTWILIYYLSYLYVSTSTSEAAGVRAGETGRRNRRPNKRYAGPEWYT
jgi:hypothetical protein